MIREEKEGRLNDFHRDLVQMAPQLNGDHTLDT